MFVIKNTGNKVVGVPDANGQNVPLIPEETVEVKEVGEILRVYESLALISITEKKEEAPVEAEEPAETANGDATAVTEEVSAPAKRNTGKGRKKA